MRLQFKIVSLTYRVTRGIVNGAIAPAQNVT